MAVDLLKLEELNENPFGFDSNQLNSGKGIESTLISNNACWHKSFRNRINSTEIKRENEESKTSSVKTRTSVGDSTEKVVEQCLFCDQRDGNLHKPSAFEIDNKVRKYAIDLLGTKLLSKLAGGAMVAIDAVYHSKCLVTYYNRARQNCSIENICVQSASRLNAIAFAQVVPYIQGFRACQETVTVFTLMDLSKMYSD